MTPSTKKTEVIIIGAGPAGLTAAYKLQQQGYQTRVLEADQRVGGISRTENYKGYRIDIGGHRFFTKVSLVLDLWKEILPDDFIRVQRLSRIFYHGKYYDYPLSLLNTLKNLGIGESFLILLSYFKAILFPIRNEQSFADWVSNRFGTRLFNTFFKTYTEKVWGISCQELRAEWAAQRIKGLSLPSAVLSALNLISRPKSLIEEFSYPLHGPGMLWERCASLVEQMGGSVECTTDVISLAHENGKINTVTLRRKNGELETLAAEQFISTMPVTTLIQRLNPAPSSDVLYAASQLRYRAFLIVTVIIKRPSIFPDQWLYIHDAGFKVGRIQNFKNWSAALVPDASTTSLGMEYFCNEGDEFWNSDDASLIALASEEIVRLGFADASDIQDAVVIRQPKSYPVYNSDYAGHLQCIREYLGGFSNLQTIGRNGLHRYNNQDHSMLTALLAVENLEGKQHDVWQVNTEKDYHEEIR